MHAQLSFCGKSAYVCSVLHTQYIRGSHDVMLRDARILIGVNRHGTEMMRPMTQMGEEELADEFEVNMMESRQAVNFAGELCPHHVWDCAPTGATVSRGFPADASNMLCPAAFMFLVPLVTGFCISPARCGAGVRIHAAAFAAGICPQ